MTLSDQDKIFKAQAIKQKMELEADLGNFAKLVDELFKIDPPLKLTPADKQELKNLSTAIRAAAATNDMRARALELIGKGLASH